MELNTDSSSVLIIDCIKLGAHAVLKAYRCFLPAASAAELGEQLLLRAGQLGRGESERRRRAAQEVHPGTARSSAHRRVPQHLQRRQRSVCNVFNILSNSKALN